MAEQVKTRAVAWPNLEGRCNFDVVGRLSPKFI